MDELLTVKDVQRILKIGRRQAYELVNRPDFQKIRIGKSIRIPVQALQNWLNQQAS